MKYLLLFVLNVFLVAGLSAQTTEPTERSAPAPAAVAVKRFEGRLTRLREALEKNDASASISCYNNLLGDVRSALEQEEKTAPEGEKIGPMRRIFAKLEAFQYDPNQLEALKPYLVDLEEFRGLLARE